MSEQAIDPLRRHLWLISRPGRKPRAWHFPPLRVKRAENKLRRIIRR